jgi:hypothetical protein
MAIVSKAMQAKSDKGSVATQDNASCDTESRQVALAKSPMFAGLRET